MNRKSTTATMLGQAETIRELNSITVQLKQRITHLEEEHRDMKGALTQSTKLVEAGRKDLESVRIENTQLREHLQRALGYIDRVIEDSPTLSVEQIEPPRFRRRERGPNLMPINFGSYANDGDGGGMYNPMTPRRY